MGNEGWDWGSVLPYFKKAENWNGGADELRGTKCPLRTAFGRYKMPLFDAFIKAGQQAGYPFNPDYNSAEQEGFVWTQYTHAFPMRCSAARTYIWPARHRKNLAIWTNARVRRLTLDGKRITGVEVDHKGKKLTVTANREVILSAGSYHSPQLLMLSGIGDPAALSEHGIVRRHAIPGVGKNLQDQIGSFVQHRCTQPITYYNMTKPLRLAFAVLQYAFKRSGPLAIFPMNTMAFLKSDPALERPDIQYYLLPAAMNSNGSPDHLPKFHGYNIHWCGLRPQSTGHVGLRSSDHLDAPVVVHNYLTAHADQALNR